MKVDWGDQNEKTGDAGKLWNANYFYLDLFGSSSKLALSVPSPNSPAEEHEVLRGGAEQSKEAVLRDTPTSDRASGEETEQSSQKQNEYCLRLKENKKMH